MPVRSPVFVAFALTVATAATSFGQARNSVDPAQRNTDLAPSPPNRVENPTVPARRAPVATAPTEQPRAEMPRARVQDRRAPIDTTTARAPAPVVLTPEVRRDTAPTSTPTVRQPADRRAPSRFDRTYRTNTANRFQRSLDQAHRVEVQQLSPAEQRATLEEINRFLSGDRSAAPPTTAAGGDNAPQKR